MGNSGKSVLWFLGACLVFSQGIFTAVAKIYTTVDGESVLLFGFLSLATVLGALLLMFRQNPAFLTAERQDLVNLSLIQEVARKNNPRLLTYLIRTLSPETWTSGEVEVKEEQDTGEIGEEHAEEDDDEIDADADSDQGDFTKAFEIYK
ncbi:MAG: hypothetical protein ACYSWZ_01575 [Planctomycetota bacterium]|jgi:hypothetical protein